MKGLLLLGIIFILGASFARAQPKFIQARAIGLGSDSAGGSTARAIALDRHNNYYVAGEFSETVRFDSIQFMTRLNFYEPFIAKYDSNFNLIWATSPAGPRTAYDLALDTSANSYITGWMGGYAIFNGDTVWGRQGFNIYLAKYDTDGRVLWARSDGGDGDDIGLALTIDRSGDVYLTGVFSGTAAFGSDSIISQGGYDIFIAKYDSNGMPLWVCSAGGEAVDDRGLSIAVDLNGSVYATGYFEGTAVFGTDTVISAIPEIYNAFIVKYDADGNYQWMRQPKGFTAARGQSLTVDTAGYVYITGDFEGTAIFGNDTLVAHEVRDIFVAKLDAEGTTKWGRSGGGKGQDAGNAIALDNHSNVYITGIVDVSPAYFGADTLRHNGWDILVASYDSSGTLRWLKAGGSNFQESSKDIAVNNNGDIYIGGGFGTPSGELRLDSLVVRGVPGRGSTLLAKLRERQPVSSVAPSTAESTRSFVYPNPSRGTFSLFLNNHTDGNATITITDLLGRTKYQTTYTSEALQSAIGITLEGIAPGLYWLQVMTNGSMSGARLIIE